jgi:hypothetical protein
MAGLKCKLPQESSYKIKALTAEGIAISSVVKVNAEPKMDSLPETNMKYPTHNSRKKTNGNNRHNHRSITKIGLRALVAITSDAMPWPTTIRYTPLDDLEQNKCSNKTGVHLDNVTLHQQY